MGLVPGEADGLGPWREGGGAQESPPGGGPQGGSPQGEGVAPGCGTMWVGPGG